MEKYREYVKLRLDGISDSAKRARWILCAILVACSIQVIVVWNQHASWMHLFAESRLSSADQLKLLCQKDAGLVVCASPFPTSMRINKLLEESMLNEWIKSLTFDFPIVGASASVSDLGILGGFVLLVLVAWMSTALRRENHLIHDLFCEARRKIPSFRTIAFYGVVNEQLFAAVSSDEPRSTTDKYADEPFSIKEIDAVRAERIERRKAYRRSFLARKLSLWKMPLREPERLRYILPRAIALAIFYAPIITLLMVQIADVYSLYTPSIFRRDEGPLITHLSPFDYIPRVAVGCALLFFVTRMTVLAFNYQKATVELLQQAYDDGWDILDGERDVESEREVNGELVGRERENETTG